MKEKKNIHDFLTINELETFNDKVNRIVSGEPSKPSEPKTVPGNEKKEVPFDSNKYQSFIVNPKDIPDDLLYQLADIIDKKTEAKSISFVDI